MHRLTPDREIELASLDLNRAGDRQASRVSFTEAAPTIVKNDRINTYFPISITN
jgi:hypothetical protein